MRRILWFILVFSLGFSNAATAGVKSGGLAASHAAPKGDFKDLAGNGFGVAAIFDYPMAGIVNISGALGWYRFSGLDANPGLNDKTDSLSLWEFSAGPQIDLGMLYFGAEGGYYTKLDEWGLVLNVGIRKNLVELSLRYKMTEDGKFLATRAGFYF